MPLPTPEPGLVVAYSYLWNRHEAAGTEEGNKDRPCVIIVATRKADDETVVTVVPMTTRAPDRGRRALALPPRVGQHIGLGDSPSWIIVDEVNRFVWPGPDLRQISGRPGHFAYGFIPPRLFAGIKAAILDLHQSRRLRHVTRSN